VLSALRTPKVVRGRLDGAATGYPSVSCRHQVGPVRGAGLCSLPT
jgi:hypothetical protein